MIQVFQLQKKLIQTLLQLVSTNFQKIMELLDFAFRLGNDHVDVGYNGSNLDAETYNLTYYSTSPIKNDKNIDTIIGIGKIKLNIINRIR